MNCTWISLLYQMSSFFSKLLLLHYFLCHVLPTDCSLGSSSAIDSWVWPHLKELSTKIYLRGSMRAEGLWLLWPSSWSAVHKFFIASESGVGLVETQIAGPTLRAFDLMSLGRAWDFCIANRFPGDADTAGVGTAGLDAPVDWASRSSGLGSEGMCASQLFPSAGQCMAGRLLLDQLSHHWDFPRIRWEHPRTNLLVFILTLGPSIWSFPLFISQKVLQIPGTFFPLSYVFKSCWDIVAILVWFLERGEVNMWVLSTILKWKFIYYIETLDKWK